MSLINEALKRTEQKRRTVPANGRDESADPRDKPALPPRLRAAMILSVFALVAVGIVTWVSLPPQTANHVPARGHAATADGARPVAMKPAPPPPAGVPVPPTREVLTQEPPAPVASVRKSLADLGSYSPPPVPQTPAPAEPAAVAPPPVLQPEPAQPEPPPPATDTAGFKLGAILSAGANSHALINNQLVRVGDEVDGAKVIDIGKYHVTIEKDGQRLTLRM